MASLLFRNLKKKKGFTAINIIGLVIAMTAAILIILWVYSQLNFDRFYPNSQHIYAVGSKESTATGIEVWFSTPKPLAQAAKAGISDVKNICRLTNTGGFLFTIADTKILGKRDAFVDSSFLTIFQLPLLAGDPKTALISPTSIVLTKDFALALFGSTEIIGKRVNLNNGIVLEVSAVLDEIPDNSRFAKVEYFLPWTLMEKLGLSDNKWENSSVELFVELSKGAHLAVVQEKFKQITKKHAKLKTENFLVAIGDTHLFNEYKNGVPVGGRMEMVRIFTLIAGFILLIACINFTNLSTAQSEQRIKEIGIRKVLGIRRVSLIAQFLFETFLLATFSGILALFAVLSLVPIFENILGTNLILPLTNFHFWISLVGFIFLIALLAGSYPAFFLSSFPPAVVLKGNHVTTRKGLTPRRVLVVFQFSVAVFLVICTLVIKQQVSYAKKRHTGFDREKTIYIAENDDLKPKLALIQHDLITGGIASSVCRTMSPITENWSNWNGFNWEGKDPTQLFSFNRLATDQDIVETMGLTLVAGRDFDLDKFPTDSMSVLINESAGKILGFKNPLDHEIRDGKDNYKIIGIVQDFIQESPFGAVKPTLIQGSSKWLNTFNIRFSSKLNTKDAIAKTEAVFKQHNPNYPFEFNFLDEAYGRKFEDAEKAEKLLSIFAFVTILVSCLGLFGLAAYMSENRIREIGIRKVLGASVFSISKMLSGELVFLVGLSCLIAFPIAYWTMNEFINLNAYRKSIGWEIFVNAACIAFTTTLFATSYQSIKSALANPIHSLKQE